MGLSPTVDLDIVECVLYGILLVPSIFVLIRHGARRQSGWIFLTLLCIARIIGGATGIAAHYHPDNKSLVECADIMNSFGLSFLIGATLGLVSRVNGQAWKSAIPGTMLQLAFLPLTVALIISIVGSTKIFNNDPSSRSDGYDFLKGGSILFLVTAIGIALLILYLFTKLSSIASGESRLLYAAIVAVPFIAVRIVYTLIAVFSEYKGDFSAFSNTTDAVLFRGIMVVAMEVIVIIIYIAAGLTAQKLDKNAQKNRNAGMPPSEYQPQDQPQMAPTGNRY